MMKKISRWIAVTLCVALCVCGCTAKDGADETKKPEASETKKDNNKKEKSYQKKLDLIKPSAYDNVMGLKLEAGTSLSIIGKAEDVPYWEEVRRGAEQAVKDINENLGYEGKKQVKVTYSAPSTPDNVDEQVNILDEELARYPAALGIAIVDTKACEVQFDLAAESDIPVVAFDSGSDYQGLMAMVSTDNRTAAREAAQKLAESVDEKGEVILFIHDSKSESAMTREQAFREEMEGNYPEITIAEIYYMDQLSEMQKAIAAEMKGVQDDAEEAGNDDANGGDGNDSQPGEEGENVNPEEETEEREGDNHNQPGEESENVNPEDLVDLLSEEEVIDYLFEKHPEVKGVYATNGEAVKLAVEAVERNDSRASIIGFDADKEVLEALEAGIVDELVLQNPFGMGYAAVVASARAALSMGNEAVVDTGYVWITKRNLEEEGIQRLLY
jgi:ribose transport system substrate-binding protein